jgi:hypothetical protein
LSTTSVDLLPVAQICKLFVSSFSVHPRLFFGQGGCSDAFSCSQRLVACISLSPQQFQALDQAAQNWRIFNKTLQKKENIYRQILFASLPDTCRRNPLPRRVLGVN